MKTKTREILAHAKRSGRAIGAFNVSSIEAMQAVFEAASQVGVPIIIQTSAGEAMYLMPEVVTEVCSTLSKVFHVEYIVHLDRGNDIDLMQRCLDAGYDSISSEFAGSTYEEVVAKTLAVRNLTNRYVAYHEGAIEVTPLRYYEDTYQKDLKITDPPLAKQFVSQTGVDSLAVSIGNQSGRLKTSYKLNIDVLRELNTLLPETPFVLHGGSYLEKESIVECIRLGVAKINVNTEVRLAYVNRLKKNILKDKNEYAPYRLLKGVKDEMRQIVINKLHIFNSL